MIEILKKITLNDLKRFYRSVFFTTLSDYFGFLGVIILIVFVERILAPFLGKSEVSFNELFGICALAALYMVVYYFVQLPMYKANFENTYKLSAQGRLKLAEHIRKLPLGFLEGANPMRLSHTLMNDFTKLEGANSHLLPQTCSSLILVLFVFVGLCFYHWQMALSFFACVPVAIAILVGIRKFAAHLSARHHHAVLQASNVINEYIDGMNTIKAYNMGGSKFARVERAFDSLRKESIRIEVSLMPFALSVLSCMGAGIGIMVMVGREFLLSGEMSVIEYIGFLLIGSKAFVPLMTFCVNFIDLQYYAKAGANILELFAQDVIKGEDKAIPQGNTICLENVSFSYGDCKPVLHNINLTIRDKTSLAIVGESGSGKSTMVKLIARFYEPTSGRIWLGDENERKDIATLEPEALMQKFSMVFQKVHLFEGSIASNLAFAKENVSKQEMRKVLQDANALGFVDSMSEGIESKIAEGGKSLSGGQKQRISIARCLLKNAPIVLLDEISSSLDVINERALQRAINRLTKDKSVIIIAHKLRSIVHCDKIIVLQKTPQGSIIAESGTHKELLALNGLYARAWTNETRM
ncbi:ABC transporter ATP-binding protein [Helicobacter sp. MIT 14-3879]|uniref:ABC transporter ATP-binding protein n=1 Tax=Helicobacter sp. MIT 14-3879 TaxID=2040649 RepID=UPI000E1EACF9|nr:ABC transporter ATP-binding protein [Helicobacter sp. MIT 14-3879]RDU61292.1 ABC transporter ATP-binding protein [Helicobacter sp. MIT 14-3879]